MNNSVIPDKEVNAALQHLSTHLGPNSMTADTLAHLDVNTMTAILERWYGPLHTE